MQVFAALAAAWMPWLFLSSLHTDTTTLFGVLAFGSLAAVYLGMTENGRWLWLSGALIGLAMLTRNDGVMLIPAGILGGLWLAWRGGYRVQWRHVLIAGIAVILVLLPWLLRNQSELGTSWPGSTARSMFVTDHEDFYAYSKDISLQTYLDQGSAGYRQKIGFEMAASVKLMITLVESDLPGGDPGRAAGLLMRGPATRIRRRCAGGARSGSVCPGAVFHRPDVWRLYVLMPYLSQGGSFKKAYLAMVPFLLIIGAQTGERYVNPRRAYWSSDRDHVGAAAGERRRTNPRRL